MDAMGIPQNNDEIGGRL